MTASKEKEITPRQAARLLGIHLNTVYAWCQRCVESGDSRFRNVRLSPTGRYWILRADVEAIQRHFARGSE